MFAEALNDADQKRPRLSVRTASLTLSGSWRGVHPVRRGDTVDLEVELPGTPRWSDLVGDSRNQGHRGSQATVRGHIETVDGNVVLARVESALLQIELLDTPPIGAAGTEIEIAADDLEFYPTGI